MGDNELLKHSCYWNWRTMRCLSKISPTASSREAPYSRAVVEQRTGMASINGSEDCFLEAQSTISRWWPGCNLDCEIDPQDMLLATGGRFASSPNLKIDLTQRQYCSSIMTRSIACQVSVPRFSGDQDVVALIHVCMLEAGDRILGYSFLLILA